MAENSSTVTRARGVRDLWLAAVYGKHTVTEKKCGQLSNLLSE